MGHISDASRYFNRSLLLSVLVIAVSTFNYGFDNQAFATTQAMDAFAKQFGAYDKASGSYELNAVWLSLFSSLNYIGFVVGEWRFCQTINSSDKPFVPRRYCWQFYLCPIRPP